MEISIWHLVWILWLWSGLLLAFVARGNGRRKLSKTQWAGFFVVMLLLWPVVAIFARVTMRDY